MTMARYGVRLALIGALALCVALTGCGADGAALQESFDRGYAAGLAEAQQNGTSDDCRSCYGLGFTEGYQQGYADGAANKSAP